MIRGIGPGIVAPSSLEPLRHRALPVQSRRPDRLHGPGTVYARSAWRCRRRHPACRYRRIHAGTEAWHVRRGLSLRRCRASSRPFPHVRVPQDAIPGCHHRPAAPGRDRYRRHRATLGDLAARRGCAADVRGEGWPNLRRGVSVDWTRLARPVCASPSWRPWTSSSQRSRRDGAGCSPGARLRPRSPPGRLVDRLDAVPFHEGAGGRDRQDPAVSRCGGPAPRALRHPRDRRPRPLRVDHARRRADLLQLRAQAPRPAARRDRRSSAPRRLAPRDHRPVHRHRGIHHHHREGRSRAGRCSRPRAISPS